MALNSAFQAQAARRPKPKNPTARPAPFSIRLSQAERAQLEREAKDVPLGAYIKAKALEGAPLRVRRRSSAVEDSTALARTLALLGQSRLSSNLNQLAHAANTGSLPITPETEAFLRRALSDVQAMRCLLITALGLKTESDS